MEKHINQMTEEELVETAKKINDEDNEKNALAFLDTVTSQENLAFFAKNLEYYAGFYALKKITDENILVKFINTEANVKKCEIAIEKIANQNTIINILYTSGNTNAIVAAIAQITDQKALAAFANSTTDEYLRLEAILKITDADVLEKAGIVRADYATDISMTKEGIFINNKLVLAKGKIDSKAIEKVLDYHGSIDYGNLHFYNKKGIVIPYAKKSDITVHYSDDKTLFRGNLTIGGVPHENVPFSKRECSNEYIASPLEGYAKRCGDYIAIFKYGGLTKEEEKKFGKKTFKSVYLAYKKMPAPIKEIGEYLVFENFNFKLAIIQELMYNQNITPSKFDVYEFLDRDYVEKYGYDELEKARDYFEQYKIDKAYERYVKELNIDAGDEIYGELFPFWDGEDEIYNITDISEAEIMQFTKLKKISSWHNLSKKTLSILKKQRIRFVCDNE